MNIPDNHVDPIDLIQDTAQGLGVPPEHADKFKDALLDYIMQWLEIDPIKGFMITMDPMLGVTLAAHHHLAANGADMCKDCPAEGDCPTLKVWNTLPVDIQAGATKIYQEHLRSEKFREN